jgi:activator of 2-hydroxyglutaryl-CoA dehydratase
MIHLQQIATPLQDIVAGLCFALARNFRSNVARSKEIKKPVVFSGGVAANIGMVRAFKEILNLNDNELIIPKHHASMGAIGAVYYVKENNKRNAQFKGMKALEDYLSSNTKPFCYTPTTENTLVEYKKQFIS